MTPFTSLTAIFVTIIIAFHNTQCSHIEIIKAENLIFNQQKVKNFLTHFKWNSLWMFLALHNFNGPLKWIFGVNVQCFSSCEKSHSHKKKMFCDLLIESSSIPKIKFSLDCNECCKSASFYVMFIIAWK